ncbi:MAG: nucleotidyl transferase AbiEii/AbiGii toxin family protein [Bacteroidales bacterium]|nr:nucleotidyl transferase AbiEii/AbiGii toxin family protein [Bacteroidales bacterium]
MHKEILSGEQLELLPLVKQFMHEYYLVGVTAVALYIGHRRSIDFDLFKFSPLKHQKIVQKITEFSYPYIITRRATEQLNVNVGNVKLTFFEYPFKIDAPTKFENVIRLPELIDLAAMKAYALGRRSKWKDYIDIYFILKYFYSIDQISKKANEIYNQLFSEKLFRAQLSYFDDIDYSEPVEYLVPAVSGEEIKEFLIDKATDINLEL